MIDHDTIYLDMDGVLADFISSALSVHGRDPEEVLRSWPPGKYDVVQVLGMSEQKFWREIDAHGGPMSVSTPGQPFWKDLKPYPWRDAIWDLCGRYAPTCILTSPSKNSGSVAGKVRWLQDWMGYDFRDYILAPRKWRVSRPGAVLIDDQDRNCQKWEKAGGTAIVFPRPWNSRHELAHEAYMHVACDLSMLEWRQR